MIYTEADRAALPGRLAYSLSSIVTQARAYGDETWLMIKKEAADSLRDFCHDRQSPTDACDLVQDTRPDYPNVFVCRTCEMSWVRHDDHWSSGDWHGPFPWEKE